MAVATYVHRQEAAKAQGGGEHIVSWMTNSELFECLAVLTAVFFPPLSVLLERGCGGALLLNLLLTCLGFVPGLIHALFILYKVRLALEVHALFILYKNESSLVYSATSYAPSTLVDARTKELTLDDILRAASDEDRQERVKMRRERGGNVNEADDGKRRLDKPSSYRSKANSSDSSDEDGDGKDAYARQAQMSEKRRGKQPAERREDRDLDV